MNDRPYVASSFLSVALADQFGTAMNGRSKEPQDLADQTLPFEVGIPVLPAHGGDALVRKLFEPLGYRVAATGYPLDTTFPAWGEAPYRTVTLSGVVRIRDLLSHLYVLIPVLDDQKHYWVSAPEIEKLLKRGEGWLSTHPERELIARRYLARQPNPRARRCVSSWSRRTLPTRIAARPTVTQRKPQSRSESASTITGSARSWLPCEPAAPSACSTWAAARAGSWAKATGAACGQVSPCRIPEDHLRP